MSSKTIELDLGSQYESVTRRVESGQYDDASDVIRSALRALDREDDALDAFLYEKVNRSLSDPRPSVSAKEVFERLRARHADRAKAAQRGG